MSSNKQQLIEELKALQEKTISLFDLPETDLTKSYAPGKWTVRQLLHHITDAETVLYDRIRRAISKPNQVIWAFDQDAWAKHLNYQDLPMYLNKAVYAAVREAAIYLVDQYYDTLGEQHQFVHSDTGVRSLKDEMEKLAWHNAGHLEQIEQALGRSSK